MRGFHIAGIMEQQATKGEEATDSTLRSKTCHGLKKMLKDPGRETSGKKGEFTERLSSALSETNWLAGFWQTKAGQATKVSK